MKTAIELLADKLKEMGADGLCNHDCGCVLGSEMLVPMKTKE